MKNNDSKGLCRVCGGKYEGMLRHSCTQVLKNRISNSASLILDYKREWERNKDVLGPETEALVAARDALFAAVGDVEDKEQGGRNERREEAADGQ